MVVAGQAASREDHAIQQIVAIAAVLGGVQPAPSRQTSGYRHGETFSQTSRRAAEPDGALRSGVFCSLTWV